MTPVTGRGQICLLAGISPPVPRLPLSELRGDPGGWNIFRNQRKQTALVLACALVAACGGNGGDDDGAAAAPENGATTTSAPAASSGSASRRVDICETIAKERVAQITGRQVTVANANAYEEGEARLVNACEYRSTGGTTNTGNVASIETLRFPDAPAATQDFASAYKSWQPASGFGDEAAQLHTAQDQIAARFGSVHLRVSVNNLNREPARYALAEQLMRAAADALQPTF